MTRSELEYGMVVEYRNGERGYYVYCGYEAFLTKDGFMLPFKDCNEEDLTDVKGDRDWDIVTVYEGSSNKKISYSVNRMLDDFYGDCLWKRSDEVVELSRAEIEQKLGLKPGQLKVKD